MSKQVYIINGSGGVGKDTFCDLVGKFVPVKVISSVDPIKDLAKKIGWDGQKTERDRKFLSDLKDLTTKYNDYPMQYMRKEVKDFLLKDWEYILYKQHSVKGECMFIHIREPQEIDKAVREFNARTILVTNPNVEQISTNHADANVEDYKYHVYIKNNGTLENLENIAKKFCENEGLI